VTSGSVLVPSPQSNPRRTQGNAGASNPRIEESASYRLCLKCFRSAKSENEPESESSESDHLERECERCNQDISDRQRRCHQCEGCGTEMIDKPASYRLCPKCFRSAKSEPEPESESSESDQGRGAGGFDWSASSPYFGGRGFSNA